MLFVKVVKQKLSSFEVNNNVRITGFFFKIDSYAKLGRSGPSNNRSNRYGLTMDLVKLPAVYLTQTLPVSICLIP